MKAPAEKKTASAKTPDEKKPAVAPIKAAEETKPIDAAPIKAAEKTKPIDAAPIRAAEETKPIDAASEMSAEGKKKIAALMKATAGGEKKAKAAAPSAKKGKQARVWELSGKNADSSALDYSAPPPPLTNDGKNATSDREGETLYAQNVSGARALYYSFFKRQTSNMLLLIGAICGQVERRFTRDGGRRNSLRRRR